jgi:hypothetical protein
MVKRVSGQGIGTLICPDNSQNPVHAIFMANQSNGDVTGNWVITDTGVF